MENETVQDLTDEQINKIKDTKKFTNFGISLSEKEFEDLVKIYPNKSLNNLLNDRKSLKTQAAKQFAKEKTYNVACEPNLTRLKKQVNIDLVPLIIKEKVYEFVLNGINIYEISKQFNIINCIFKLDDYIFNTKEKFQLYELLIFRNYIIPVMYDQAIKYKRFYEYNYTFPMVNEFVNQSYKYINSDKRRINQYVKYGLFESPLENYRLFYKIFDPKLEEFGIKLDFKEMY